VDFVEIAEYIQQHDRQDVDAAEPRRVASRDGVEPSATARTPGHRAVLVAAVAQMLAGRVVLLGRKGPAAHASAVRLDDPDDAIQVPARHTAARRDADS